MTNRRSLQTGAARQSRQTQFVPGHVGGRVASAQPVRSRRTIGATARPVGEPPDMVYMYDADASSNSIGAGAFPTDMTHALVLVGGMNCTDITPPAGWTELAGGGPYGAGDVSGGIIAQWSLMHTTDPTASTTFTFPTATPLSGTAQFASLARAYFTGGSTGGTWTVTAGTHTSNSTAAYATGVDASAAAWAQFVLLTGVYTWVDNGGFHAGQGKMTSARYPAQVSGGVTISGETPRPDGTLIDWAGIGAYGKPNSLTFAVTWTP